VTKRAADSLAHDVDDCYGVRDPVEIERD